MADLSDKKSLSLSGKQILVVDTRAGNLFSLRAALERLGAEVIVLAKPDEKKYDAIVIPGQGRFGTVMENISANNWPAYFELARQKNIPMLGICVGMQIFFETSEEDPEAQGLGWFKGKVQRLDFPKKPMVGWAEIEFSDGSNSCVYFVNSFAIKQSDKTIATTNYGEVFCAAIKEGSFTGMQFHPEKSAAAGAILISEALNLTERY